MNQLIPARKTQMSLKTDGSVSRSLTAEKMHFITIRKYHFAHSPLAEIKLSEETVLVRVWVSRHSRHCWRKWKLEQPLWRAICKCTYLLTRTSHFQKFIEQKMLPDAKQLMYLVTRCHNVWIAKTLKASTECWLNKLQYT